jgi:hypothetical protein
MLSAKAGLAPDLMETPVTVVKSNRQYKDFRYVERKFKKDNDSGQFGGIGRYNI